MKKLANSAFPDASHRMNLPPCNGIKRAESTDLTNRVVAGAAISSVADWIGEIKKVWARGSSSTLDLTRVVSAAKNRLQRHYGQWSQLWESGPMPLSKSTADRLATVGDRMGWIDSATSLNLPRGWNILFCLARLDRGALEQLIQQGLIHPELTLREAKALVAEFTGKQTAAGQPKANVRERLRRFEEFVQDTLHGWTALDRELARATLSQMTEQIGQPSSLASGSDLYPKTTRRSSDALALSSAASQADHSNSLHNL